MPSQSIARKNMKRSKLRKRTSRRTRINKRQNTKRRRLNKRQNTKRRRLNKSQNTKRRKLNKRQNTKRKFNGGSNRGSNRRVRFEGEFTPTMPDRPNPDSIDARNEFIKRQLDQVVMSMHTFNNYRDEMAKSWKNYVNESVRNPEVQGWAHGLYKGVIGKEKLSSLGKKVMRMESDLPRLIEEELVYPQTIGEYLYDNYFRGDLPL